MDGDRSNSEISTIQLEIENDELVSGISRGAPCMLHRFSAHGIDPILGQESLGNYFLPAKPHYPLMRCQIIEINYWPVNFAIDDRSVIRSVVELADTPDSMAAIYSTFPSNAVLRGELLPEGKRFFIDNDKTVHDGNGNLVDINERIAIVDAVNIPFLITERKFLPQQIIEVQKTLGTRKLFANAEGRYTDYARTPATQEELDALIAPTAPEGPTEFRSVTGGFSYTLGPSQKPMEYKIA